MMKNIKLKILSAVMAIVVMASIALFSAGAVTLYTDGAYTYADVDSSNVALYGFDNSSDTMKIREMFDGKLVSSIYEYSFEKNDTVKHLDFSNNNDRMKTIGTKAFAASALEGELTLPSSIRTVGFAAFQECGKIEVAKLDCRLKEIPAQMFNRCGNLETVYLPITAETIGNLAFANCPKLSKVYIPSSVTEIASNAFSGAEDVVIYCYRGSYAKDFAEQNKLEYYIMNPLKGDANNDGTVDISDVTYIQKNLVGMDGFELNNYQRQCADVNADGEVTLRDATQIQKYLVGLVASL